ncbi:MAG TPA: hypothetical protein VKY90_07655 [Candidatus Dormibacteraeota bacterium]|nr:hypothetical protein [Candidatus Dormibacteraeota bacterium]
MIRDRACLPGDLETCLGVVRGLPELFTAKVLEAVRHGFERRGETLDRSAG